MNQAHFDRRRALLSTLAGVVLGVVSGLSFGQDNAAPDKAVATPPKDVDAEKGVKGTARKKVAVVKVIVIGDDQPVEKAEVKFWFPAILGGDVTVRTNAAGEAEFSSAATGVAKVRVIADGWKTILNPEVNLKEGPQQLTIKLTPLP